MGRLIQCYAPTSDCATEEIDTFYGQLDEALQQCKSYDVKIIMGDFNAKFCHDKDGEAIGSFGLGQRNERGEINLVV